MMLPRAIGVDFGSKRTGIAVSDPLGITCQPYCVIEYSIFPELLKRIKQIVEEKSAKTVVIGMPKNMDNTQSDKGREVEVFAEMLKGVLGEEVAIEFQDERLTSVQAQKFFREVDMSRAKKRVQMNAISAQIMLQSWMDKTQRQSTPTDKECS